MVPDTGVDMVPDAHFGTVPDAGVCCCTDDARTLRISTT